MNKKIKIKSICADCSGLNNNIFDVSSDCNIYDYSDACIFWDIITFYGIPFDFEDEEISDFYEGDYTEGVKIGKLTGCMIMCKQMIDQGYDPLITCDDVDGDLEYTISALSDIGGPLNVESGEPYQDVYYIDELYMDPNYDEETLKSRIIEEIPRIVASLFHTFPDILAYYPAPLEYEPDPGKEARYSALQNIAIQKLDNTISEMFTDSIESEREDAKNILKFGDLYQFSDDELKMVMRRRNSESSYPAEARDKKEYNFYEKNGFKEVGDSRLLYKDVTNSYR